MLQSQDVAVIMALAAFSPSVDGRELTYVGLAEGLGLSPSGVHKSIRRAVAAGLVRPDGRRILRSAVLELVIHGVRYVFPAVRGRAARGVPTASSAPILRARLAVPTGATELVWPHRDGTVRGESIEPLYPGAPSAALANRTLYDLLALIDALRVGGAREREVAIELLEEVLPR